METLIFGRTNFNEFYYELYCTELTELERLILYYIKIGYLRDVNNWVVT